MDEVEALPELAMDELQREFFKLIVCFFTDLTFDEVLQGLELGDGCVVDVWIVARDLSEELAAAQRAPKFIEPNDLASFFKVAHSTITRGIRAGRIHGIRIGTAWRIPVAEAERVKREGW